jgi:hypothetical protein
MRILAVNVLQLAFDHNLHLDIDLQRFRLCCPSKDIVCLFNVCEFEV